MNILIVKLSAIGDVIHTLPALASLRMLYPDANITWIIEEAASDLIRNHPYLDRAIISSRKRWIKEIKAGEIISPFNEMKEMISLLRDRTYDMVIDFHGLLKSAVFVFLSGGKRKLGYDSLQEMSGLFLNEKIPEDMNKHAVDRYLDFLRYLGADERKPEFLIPVEQENRTYIDSLLREHLIGVDEPFVIISPVALWETKLWDDEKIAALADKIIEELKCRIIITGNDDLSRMGRIQSMMSQPVVNLSGKTSLLDLAYLCKRASLMVTTDSGPMHLAVAMGTPVVALFGPTDHVRTGPYGERNTVIFKSMSCRPCFQKTCRTINCMHGITVAEVFNAVKEKIYCLKKTCDMVSSEE